VLEIEPPAAKKNGARRLVQAKDMVGSDREAFFARLQRSRTTRSKAQHLRIQAGHLSDTREPRLVGVALDLLETLF